MATTLVTNKELLAEDAVRLGMTKPEAAGKSSAELLAFIVANGQTTGVTKTNSQDIAQNQFDIKTLQARGKFIGTFTTLDKVEKQHPAGSGLNNGDYVLVGASTNSYKLYTWLGNAWEFGSKSTINIVATAGALPGAYDAQTNIEGLTTSAAGAMYFVRDESVIYLWLGSTWQAVTTP
ncbi:MAG: hypothetical protein KAH01_05310, partial [Caldisericia bacterium]|nr:hypothetical protein [Caldisericia bacterium]